jgi:hypothetical protein
VLLVLAAAGLPAGARAQAPGADSLETRIVHAFRDLGFENLSVRRGEGTVTVWYENRVFRHELTALGAAAWMASRELPPDTRLELVIQNRQVPLLAVAAPAGEWQAFLGGGPVDAFRGRISVETAEDAGDRIRDRKGLSRENSSRWRSDIAVRPIYSYEVGFFEENFRWAFWISPEWTMSPVQGLLFTLGVDIQLLNELEPCENGQRTDLVGERCPDTVYPGRATVSWGGWLPADLLGAASAGLFSDGRYGFAAEMSRLVLDGDLELTATGDVSGSLDFYIDGAEYSDIGPWSAFAGATYRFTGLDVEASVEGGRYMEGYFGGRLNLTRRFGEAEVGFTAAKNEIDDSVGARLKVALPLRRMPRPAVLRPATVPDISVSYTEERRSVTESVGFYDDTGALREQIYPTYIMNNLDVLRTGVRYVENGE